MTKLWQYIKALGNGLFKFMLRYPLATAATFFLLAAAGVMAAFGKTFQIGGILGKLWGDPGKTNPNVRIVPPPGRVDEKGNVIVPGAPDEKGYVQAPVTTDIKSPSIFTDPSTITIIHPDKGEVTIPLPTGVTNTDVKQVIEVSPDVYQIHNFDTGVDPKKVLDILNK